jgi:Ca2+-binding RTX toxin-like protein
MGTGRDSKRTRGIAALLLAAAGTVVAGPVDAAFPGSNGKIAFATGYIEVITSDGTGRVTLDAASPASNVNEPAWNATGTKLVFRDGGSSLRTMNADGSNSKPLVGMPSFVGNPTWSPNGSVIAFDHYVGGIGQESRIYVVPAAGGTPTQLVDLHANDPAYSPDGTRIAFENRAEGCCDIGVMDADGTNPVTITSGPSGNAGDQDPSWSPDGSKIAFTRSGQIWTVTADGSGPVQLTAGASASYPTWSPDGTKIAFERDEDIWVMNGDGDGTVNITNTPEEEEKAPDWGVCTGPNCPAQVNAPADRTLPEPDTGDRLRVALQIKLTRTASQPVSVRWAYRDGTATIADGDYEAPIASGTVTIPAGSTSTGDLPYSFIRGDDITEQDESYTVELSSATNAPIADAQTVITILGIAPGCPGYEDVPGIHIVGTDGDDTLEGTDGADVICGLNGNDTITGGGSGDVVDGGPGNDNLKGHDSSVYGGGGNDILYGDDGKDELRGEGTLHGGDGDDLIYGDDRGCCVDLGDISPDSLLGEGGDDRLYGGRGADALSGGAGDDVLHPGTEFRRVFCEGNDQDYFVISSGDVLRGGGGIDAADYSAIHSIYPGQFAADVRMEVRLDDSVNDGVSGDYQTCDGVVHIDPIDNVYRDVEDVIGSRLVNLLVGNEKANKLVGGRKDDRLNGNDNDDVLEGGQGADVLRGLDGNDRLSGGEHDDTLVGSEGYDYFNAGPGDDRCDATQRERSIGCERKVRPGPRI